MVAALIVARGGLDRRRRLKKADVTGFRLGLDEDLGSLVRRSDKEAKNPDLAIELFTKAIESRAFKDQPQTMGELYFGRGSAHQMKKDCVAAIADFDKAAETLNDGDLFYSRAACYLELKQGEQDRYRMTPHPEEFDMYYSC